jgi:hypothetical protein
MNFKNISYLFNLFLYDLNYVNIWSTINHVFSFKIFVLPPGAAMPFPLSYAPACDG